MFSFIVVSNQRQLWSKQFPPQEEKCIFVFFVFFLFQGFLQNLHLKATSNVICIIIIQKLLTQKLAINLNVEKRYKRLKRILTKFKNDGFIFRKIASLWNTKLLLRDKVHCIYEQKYLILSRKRERCGLFIIKKKTIQESAD